MPNALPWKCRSCGIRFVTASSNEAQQIYFGVVAAAILADVDRKVQFSRRLAEPRAAGRSRSDYSLESFAFRLSWLASMKALISSAIESSRNHCSL